VARNEQRRGAVLIGLVDRGASLEEQPGALEAFLLAREKKSGSVVPVSRPNARAGFEQQPHRLRLPVPSGPGEQRVLRVGLEPRVEPAARPPPGEEGSQRGQVAHRQVGQQVCWAPRGPVINKKTKGRR